MAPSPSPLAAIFAGLRIALEADRRGASIARGLVLSVLLLLLGRLERMACAWHAAQRRGDEPLPEELLPYTPRLPSLPSYVPGNSAEILALVRILYVIGPGPGLGLRPRPRREPPVRPRIARGPPAPTPNPRRRAAHGDRHPRRQIEAVQRGHVLAP